MKAAFLDRNLAIAELRQRAEDLLTKDERVRTVLLFGSLATRMALPSSDADILIILNTHPEKRWFDRIPEYADFFQKCSLPVEVFPFTLGEVTRLLQSSKFLQKVLRESVLLAGDSEKFQESL